MKKITFRTKNLIYVFLISLLISSCSQNTITIDDTGGIFGKTNSPVSFELNLNKNQIIAAQDGRLGIQEISAKNNKIIPAQIEIAENGANSKVAFIMPNGEHGIRKFKLVSTKSPFDTAIKAAPDSKNGQIVIVENDKKVLQYNFQTIYEKDVIRIGNEELEEHLRTERDTFVSTSIYAVPRSDYIHPLYGLEGEMLTRDWPDGGHPHHRGIFWAWPEVEYGTERGDIYALQRVFARPTENIEYTSGTVYAEIYAENLWMWEDTEPIVNEHTVIRVYRSTTNKRIIDLTIKLLAVKDSVTIATRLTNSYGGLNLRMQFPEKQEIFYFTDEVNSKPLRAWSDINGIFKGNKSTSGLMVLQHRDNPEYPGSWKDYPDLAWVQPTFPTPGTRYLLDKETPLVLRFRLIIHTGGKLDNKSSAENWDAFHDQLTPLYIIANSNN